MEILGLYDTVRIRGLQTKIQTLQPDKNEKEHLAVSCMARRAEVALPPFLRSNSGLKVCTRPLHAAPYEQVTLAHAQTKREKKSIAKKMVE